MYQALKLWTPLNPDVDHSWQAIDASWLTLIALIDFLAPLTN